WHHPPCRECLRRYSADYLGGEIEVSAIVCFHQSDDLINCRRHNVSRNCGVSVQAPLQQSFLKARLPIVYVIELIHTYRDSEVGIVGSVTARELGGVQVTVVDLG